MLRRSTHRASPRIVRCATTCASLLLFLLVGCNDYKYVAPPDASVYTFALTETTAPFMVAADSALYIVDQRVELPIKPPTDVQMAALEAMPTGPFPRMPWIERHDYEILVDYTVINLENEQIEIVVTANGINEFDEYEPSASVQDEALVADFAQWERTLVIKPYAHIAGTIREEEMDEVAVDLATVVNGVTNANLVVHPDSQSESDPRVQPFIPPVIPGLVGLRVGLRVQTDAQNNVPTPPPNVVVEFTVRVRDPNHLIVSPAHAWMLPTPTLFLPESVVPPM